MRARWAVRVLVVAGALLFGALAPSCGGGDNDTAGGIVATFTPATAAPAALSVTMRPGSVSGQNFNVQIAATDVTDFFGAAFTINIPTNVGYLSMETGQSFLRDGSFPTANLSFLADTATPGLLRIVATRLNAGTYSGVTVTGTRELVTLRFRVATTMSPAAMEFLATEAREVRNSVQPPPEGELINVTWSGGAVSAAR